MCGIAGSENRSLTKDLIDNLQHRGQSSSCDGNFGHVLHSVVGEVEQPLRGNGVLIANCEIYNWEELAEKYSFEVENDAELLLKMVDNMEFEKVLKEIDGVYAFAYRHGQHIKIARDLLGVKPIIPNSLTLYSL